MPKKPFMPLVLVEWVDSHSGRGWKDLTELDSITEALFCKSVGWLRMKTKDIITIVPHIAGEQSTELVLQGCGDMTIPRKSILKIVRLR